MIYVFDSSTMIDMFKNIYLRRFPSFWNRFDQAVITERVISVREVSNEIGSSDDRLSEWAKSNRAFFKPPVADEMVYVANIFSVPHFQTMVRKQERLQGKPVADPFVIAKAAICGGCVVTEEYNKPHSSRIPNVCAHFNVRCINLEAFMEEENWEF